MRNPFYKYWFISTEINIGNVSVTKSWRCARFPFWVNHVSAINRMTKEIAKTNDQPESNVTVISFNRI